MSAKRGRAGLLCTLLASGTFWIGMGFILAAPIMNLAYDRMSSARLKGDGSEMMPSFLATLYNEGGKTGVAMTLITIGTGILVFGCLRQQTKGRPVAAAYADGDVPPAQGDSSADAPRPVATESGHMILKTRKYLS